MMNFLSEVRSVIYGNPEVMKKFLDENDELIKQVVYQGVLEQITADSDIVLHLYDKEIKWNDLYPEVKSWNELMSIAEQMGLAYEFTQISQDGIHNVSGGDSRGLIGVVCKTIANFKTSYGI